MSIIFGLFGILFLFAVLAVIVLVIIFLARKTGILSSPDIPQPDDENNDSPLVHSQHYLKSYLQDFRTLSQSLFFRFIIIATLVGLMTIPLNMVNQIVVERSQLYDNVIAEIAGTWGHQQTLSGPALIIPYSVKQTTLKVVTDMNGAEHSVNQTSYKQYNAIVLPENLQIANTLTGQTRKRSLYESLVYQANIKINGSFRRPDIASLDEHIDEIHWDRAWFVLGISDTQAINKVSRLNWQGETVDFEPGTGIVDTLRNGFHAPLQLTEDNTFRFELSININGSRGFYFRPFGKTTDVQITSDWPHPSFQGNVLPDSREITADGFTANWSIPHLARNYPQLWTLEKGSFDLQEFTAGVNLFESVTLYSQVTRAIKYGVLFLSLTFITFLIFELGIGRHLHVVQYAVIGLALTMFYLTLLSMAEHTRFVTAYISAAGVIVSMISLYAWAAIRNLPRALLIAVLLSGLYAMLYSLLQLEDFALLAGTALLLVILGVLMFLTRNIGNNKAGTAVTS